MMFRFAILFSVVCLGSPAWGQTGLGLDFDVQIPRNVYEVDQVTLTVSLSNLVPGNIPGEGQANDATFWKDRIVVELTALPDTENGGVISATTESFILELTDPGTFEQNASDTANFDIVLTYTISENRYAFEDVMGDNDTLEIKLEFNSAEGATNQDKDETKSFTRDVDVAKQAPDGLSLSSSHLALNLSFSNEDTITYTAANDGEQTGDSKGFVAVAISSVLDNQAINAYLFNRDGTDTLSAGQCTFDFSNADGGECITCNEADGELYYLDADHLDELAAGSSGIQVVRQTDASKSSASLNNLEVGEDYAVFMYYLPDGVSRSSCLVGEATRNVSLLEYNGESEVTQTSSPKCFIATAAYGTMWHKDLDALRWFRDNVLVETLAGRAFIELYYAYSPPLADVIAENSWLRTVAQVGLWLPVQTAKFAQSTQIPAWVWILSFWLSLAALSLPLFGAIRR